LVPERISSSIDWFIEGISPVQRSAALPRGNLFYKKQFPKEEDSAVLLDLSTEAEKEQNC
jgi:hypothetical protein